MLGTCKCPQCGKKNKNSANFCQHCRASLQAQRQPLLRNNALQLREDEFAAAIHITDLSGFFTKAPLKVMPGQRALVFRKGKYEGTLQAGEYSLESFLGQLNRFGRHDDIRILVVRTTELPLEMKLEGLTTQEYLQAEVELSLEIAITDPDLFAPRLSGSAVFTLVDLRKQLLPQLRQVLAEYFHSRSIRELQADRALREAIDQHIQQNLGARLSQQGLGISGVRTIAVGHSRFDEHNQRRGECWLDVDEKRLQLEQRKQLDELYSEEEWQKIDRLETEQQIQARLNALQLEKEEQSHSERLRRIALLEKVLQADSREAILNSEAAETLAQLEQQALESKLRREDERMSWALTRELAKIQRDAERAKAELEQQQRLRQTQDELAHQQKMRQINQQIEQTRLEQGAAAEQRLAELQWQKQQAEQQNQIDQQQLSHQLAQQQKQRLAQIEADEQARRKTLLDKQAELEIQARQQQQAREQAEWEQRQKHTHLEKLAALDRAIDEQKIADEQARAQLEIQRMEAMSRLSAEALIAMAPAEQAQILAGLQRTQVMANMTEEQILALAAENSPQLADALKERYRNANAAQISERERELYAQLMAHKESETERMVNLMADQQAAQQAAQSQALDAIKEIVKSSQGNASPTIVMTPATGTATPFDMSGNNRMDNTEKILLCPSCRSENERHARYCDNCGQALS